MARVLLGLPGEQTKLLSDWRGKEEEMRGHTVSRELSRCLSGRLVTAGLVAVAGLVTANPSWAIVEGNQANEEEEWRWANEGDWETEEERPSFDRSHVYLGIRGTGLAVGTDAQAGGADLVAFGGGLWGGPQFLDQDPGRLRWSLLG